MHDFIPYLSLLNQHATTMNVLEKNHLVSMIIGVVLAWWYFLWVIPTNSISMTLSSIFLWSLGIFLCFTSGKRKGVLFFLLIGLIWSTIEYIGLRTCRPYGCFSYSDLFWPKLFGTVPILLTIMRPIFVLGIAHLVPSRYWWRRFVIRWTILLLILDLALDPVHIWQGIRSYESTRYNRFGVPLQNFFWWIITGSLSMSIVARQKTTVTHPAWKYIGIVFFMLFRGQFLLWLRQYY